MVMLYFLIFFFFKQKTAYDISVRDWSSDVCSSDLAVPAFREPSPLERVFNRVFGALVGLGLAPREIGRASCRERCNACVDLGGRRIIKKKKKKKKEMFLKRLHIISIYRRLIQTN